MYKYTAKEIESINENLPLISKPIYKEVIHKNNLTAEMVRKGGIIGHIGMIAALAGQPQIIVTKKKVETGVNNIDHLKTLKRVNMHHGKDGVDKYVLKLIQLT